MRHAMEYSLTWGLPVIDHCQDLALTRGASMHEGDVSARLGLKGWPAAAEDAAIARDIELCRLTGARVHVAHLSTARGVELVRRAKAAGLPVTAEVTPHHLTLTHERVMGPGHGLVGLQLAEESAAPSRYAASRLYDTAAKVNPPLRTEEDIAALIEGLRDGAVDCIATDHAPHALEDKLCEFDAAANGISGFETALGGLMSLVHRDIIDIMLLISKLTWEPARVLGPRTEERKLSAGGLSRHSSHLTPRGLGTLGVDAPADVALIDPDAEWVVDPDAFYSKGKTPPGGRPAQGPRGGNVRGRSAGVLARGRVSLVMEDE